MSDPFDFDDDGQVSEEEQEEAFLLFMDDEDEDEDCDGNRGGCLTMFLLLTGVTTAIISIPFILIVL